MWNEKSDTIHLIIYFSLFSISFVNWSTPPPPLSLSLAIMYVSNFDGATRHYSRICIFISCIYIIYTHTRAHTHIDANTIAHTSFYHPSNVYKSHLYVFSLVLDDIPSNRDVDDSAAVFSLRNRRPCEIVRVSIDALWITVHYHRCQGASCRENQRKIYNISISHFHDQFLLVFGKVTLMWIWCNTIYMILLEMIHS